MLGSNRKTVFASGCFDVIHGGHVEFLRQARGLGDRLVVSIAGDSSLWQHKERRAAMPPAHRACVLEAMSFVDEVVCSEAGERGLDFAEAFQRIRPQVLAVTEDDRFREAKHRLCAAVGAAYVVLPKVTPLEPVSSTQVRHRLKAPVKSPLRVDFAGGWLDVPRFARRGAFVVNCAIRPRVSLSSWPYELGGGLGGSAARALLDGEDMLQTELDAGVGWQDPAVIAETGLCVWRSGQRPELALKSDGSWLRGRMALWWSGRSHCTPALADRSRPYDIIEAAGVIAHKAVRDGSYRGLIDAVKRSYEAQLIEGMAPLDVEASAVKYCGGGWGSYVLLLFSSHEQRDAYVCATAGARAIEPFYRLRLEGGATDRGTD